MGSVDLNVEMTLGYERFAWSNICIKMGRNRVGYTKSQPVPNPGAPCQVKMVMPLPSLSLATWAAPERVRDVSCHGEALILEDLDDWRPTSAHCTPGSS